MTQKRAPSVLLVAAIAFVSLLPGSSALADTNVSGTISTNTTWTTAASPYVVTGSITVSSGVTLTVQDGVTIKVNPGLSFTVNGTLLAVGSSGSGIAFVANTATPSRGYWGSLILNSTAGSSQLTYVSVSYAGGANNTAVSIQGCSPSIDHLSVTQSSHDGVQVKNAGAAPTIFNSSASNSAGTGFIALAGAAVTVTSGTATANGYGLYVATGGAMTVNGATLTNNTSWAIGAEHDTALTGLSTVTMSGNGAGAHNAIDYKGGTITGNETWTAGVDRIVNAYTTVASTGVLTLGPGVIAKFPSWSIGLDVYGKFFAQGTSGSPITLTGTTASPGSWAGVRFESGANPSASLVSYLTLSYAGTAGSNVGALQISASSPTFDHLTVTNSSHDGIQLFGAANPNIQNSQINSNAHYGIDVVQASGASLTLNTTSFTSNAWYPLVIDPATVLSGLSGLTAVSNGGNAIAIRGVSIATNSTWHASTLPYAVTGSVNVSNGVTLTIDPGTTVKFSYQVGALTTQSGGTLAAVGTSVSPIAFTSEATSPAPGDWGPISFNLGSSPASRISYATVSYGGVPGSNTGAVRITTSSPNIDHVTFLNSGYAAVSYDGGAGGAPSITNCAFVGTAAGVRNLSAAVISARFNYWNNATGPSGSGSGTGVYVSGGVLFEPWLSSSPSTPDWFNSAAVLNRTFNPSIGVNQTINFGTVGTGSWTATWKDSGGNAVRTQAGAGSTGSVVWDGKNDSGVAQPNGTYSYTIASTSSIGDVATPARGVSIINNALALTLSGVAINQAFFSPNGDGVQDTTAITATANFDDPSWTVNVINSASTIVRSFTGAGLPITYIWDGRNSGSVVQPDGVYTLQILATDGLASANGSGTTTLDNTIPVVSNTVPVAGQTVSNVYQNGSADWGVTGSTSDANFLNWQLDYGAGASPSTWVVISSGTASVTAGTFGTWLTFPLTNGVYSIRLIARDKAGNVTTRTISPVTLGNFKIAANVIQFNAGAAGSVVYTSTIPFNLTETIYIKTWSGTLVRTLLSALRPAGTYADPWTASADPDGTYLYTVAVDDGAGHTMTVDQSNQFINGYRSYNDSLAFSAYDPFNNQPLTFTFNFAQPGAVSLAFSPVATGPDNCLPPAFCLLNRTVLESGPHTISWAGVDGTGAFRPDIKSAGIVTDQATFPVNGVVVYGRKPVISMLSLAFQDTGPAVDVQTFNWLAPGTMNLSINLSTYQNEPVSLTITFLNQSSLSTLRTISIPSQVFPFNVVETWDGRADDGSLVAPGAYTITVTATDALGNKGSAQLLGKVEY